MSGLEGEYDQNQETIQFYKIKLMQKEREISDHTAKLKKIQFKNNRDIKELKMGEDKAKLQLKEQKLKLDKSSRTLAEIQEQNNVLQHRLIELKEEKDKDIESTRAQYNHLKNQVRSYERILPTHTFMSKMGANYQQLPSYEQIFMNWKERSERYEQIDQKLKKSKIEWQQRIQTLQKVNQSLQKKKVDVEAQLRQDITKILDLQTQVTTMSIQQDETKQKISDLLQQIQSSTQKNDQLTEQNQNLQSKIDQLVRIYHTQLQAKEQQIKKITQEQFNKYEDQIQRITRVYETKQNSHLQQLVYFQEEQHRLNQKLQQEKDLFQDHYKDMYKEVEKMKKEIDLEKEQQHQIIQKLKDSLRGKDILCGEYLHKLGENQLEIQRLKIKNKIIKDQLAVKSNESDSKYMEIINEKKDLQYRVKQLMIELTQAHEQNHEKQNELRHLQHDIEEIKNKGNITNNRRSFGFSQNDESVDQARSRSNTGEIYQQIKPGVVHDLIQSQQIVHEDIRHRGQSKSSHKQGIKLKNQAIQAKIIQMQSKLSEEYKIKANQEKEKLQREYRVKLQKQKQNLQKIHEGQVWQLKKKEQQIQRKLKKIYQDNEKQKMNLNESLGKGNRKYDLLKSEKDSLELSYSNQIAEAKKDRETANLLKVQIREFQKTTKDLQRNTQSLNSQLQSLKKFKERTEVKQMKEKSISSQSSSSNLKEVMEKYTAQINKLIKENQKISETKNQVQSNLDHLNKDLLANQAEIEKLKLQIEEKIRQIEMLQDLLDHERKDRTLRTVPSLASLPDQDEQQEQNFKVFYNQAGQKEGQILSLEREVSDLKTEVQQLKETHNHKTVSLQTEMNGYIQQIIQMKLKVANSEMKASQKTHLYNQLKKKMKIT